MSRTTLGGDVVNHEEGDSRECRRERGMRSILLRLAEICQILDTLMLMPPQGPA